LIGYELDSIHTQAGAVEAVRKAEAIFIGNVFIDVSLTHWITNLYNH